MAGRRGVMGTLAAALLAVGALTATGCMREAGAAPAAQEQARPAEVPVAKVVTRQLAESAEFTGTLAAVDTVELRPRVSGYVEAVHFQEGGRVKAGQVLFQLDARPFQAALERARAELAQAEARLTHAQLELGRAEKLLSERVIAQGQLDAVTADRAAAAAQVQFARAAVRTAELERGYTQVRAPVSGRAGQALVTAGNLVSGGSAGATLLTTVVSMDPFHVYFDVDEPTYRRLVASSQGAPKAPVHVVLAGEEASPRLGQLDFLSNHVDPRTGTARARALLPNSDGRLSPGLFARVRVETGSPKDTVLVADTAVGTDQRGRYVLAVKAGGTVEQRPVELGGVVDGLRVVRSGLSGEDHIVLRGGVRPGTAITPKPVAMAGAGGTP